MLARSALVLVMLALVSGCVNGSGPPGMRSIAPRMHDVDASLIELARVDPEANERPLLVVYPRSACSANASGVIVDDGGHFLGSVAPGSAALLAVPVRARAVTIFSSVEVTAPVGTWHESKRVVLPSAPNGIVLRSSRYTARDCGPGPYFDVELATKDGLESELAENDVQWLVPSRADGQAWLDAHGRRITEILSTPASPAAPGDITHLVVR